MLQMLQYMLFLTFFINLEFSFPPKVKWAIKSHPLMAAFFRALREKGSRGRALYCHPFFINHLRALESHIEWKEGLFRYPKHSFDWLTSWARALDLKKRGPIFKAALGQARARTLLVYVCGNAIPRRFVAVVVALAVHFIGWILFEQYDIFGTLRKQKRLLIIWSKRKKIQKVLRQ